MEEVDHRPQVSPLFDVHLEHVAQGRKVRRGLSEIALLLDRRGLGIALMTIEAAQHGAILARNVLPDRIAHVVAKRNFSVLLSGASRMPQRYSGILT